MTCEAVRSQLDAYVDNELSAPEMTGLEQHLRGCSTCPQELVARLQLKRAVKAAGQRYTPDPEFRKRLQEKYRPSARWWNFSWALAAATLCLLLAVGLFTTMRLRQGSQQRLISELTDLHVIALAGSNPVDVVSTDRHTVKPWFQGRIPFTFNLPDLSKSDYQLLGGRVVYLEQTPGAQLIFQLRKHDISVFVFPERTLPSGGAFETDQRLSFHLQSWAQGGLRYFVVGDVSADDVGRLAALLRSAESS
jgi:anti-sigma factor RsiW